jgi:hypothetical protein
MAAFSLDRVWLHHTAHAARRHIVDWERWQNATAKARRTE